MLGNLIMLSLFSVFFEIFVGLRVVEWVELLNMEDKILKKIFFLFVIVFFDILVGKFVVLKVIFSSNEGV